jgi:hypothetical protein
MPLLCWNPIDTPSIPAIFTFQLGMECPRVTAARLMTPAVITGIAAQRSWREEDQHGAFTFR